MNCAKCGEPVMAGFACINCGTMPPEQPAVAVASNGDSSQLSNSPLPPMGVTVPIVPEGPVVAPRAAYRRSYLGDALDWLRELPAVGRVVIALVVLLVLVGGVWMIGTQTGKVPAPVPTAPLQPLPDSATSTTLPATTTSTTYPPFTSATTTTLGAGGGGAVTIPTNPTG